MPMVSLPGGWLIALPLSSHQTFSSLPTTMNCACAPAIVGASTAAATSTARQAPWRSRRGGIVIAFMDIPPSSFVLAGPYGVGDAAAKDGAGASTFVARRLPMTPVVVGITAAQRRWRGSDDE